MLKVDQAEVREIQVEWAQMCAAFLRRGAEGTYAAAVIFQSKHVEPHNEMSQQEIADEVSKAGFQISQKSVSRALVALEGLVPRTKPSREDIELFWDQYSRGKGAHVGENSGDNEWYTPKEYIEAAYEVMGDIDLDPASTEVANKVVKAWLWYGIEDDSLNQTWKGRVWMNPPYAQPLIDQFCAKLAKEYVDGDVDQAITLTNNATETKWFQGVSKEASALCLIEKRVKFWHPEKESAPLQGQACLYLGDNVGGFRREFLQFGDVWVR